MLTLWTLLLILVSKVNGCRERRTNDLAYLNIVAEMIDKLKFSHLIEEKHCSDVIHGPLDCWDILRDGHNGSGVYMIWPINRLTKDRSVTVFCDMDTDGGGWTVIQRRGNFLRDEKYFFKDWRRYKEGFGNIEKDFWLGNDNIFALTNQKLYSVRFDLMNWKSEKRYALYDKFWIDDEFHHYTLHIDGYSGDAGEAMYDSHNQRAFSTKDKDNDASDGSCAKRFFGGWWYGDCHAANLNGQYQGNTHEASSVGIHWHPWTGYTESLQFTEIKIRPLTYDRFQHIV